MIFHMPNTGLGSLAISDAYDPVEDKSPFRDRTQELLDIVTRPIPKSRLEGGVQPLIVTVEGSPGRGKSQIVKSIMDIVRSDEQWECDDGLIRGYLKEDVQTIYCKARKNIPTWFHLEKMLAVVKDVPVCWFVIDDALNFKKELDELIAFYSDIRHRWGRKICSLRGIKIPRGEEPLDYVDVGLPSCLIIFQDKYDMDTKIRRKSQVEISLEQPIQRHHAMLARQTLGDQAVDDAHAKNSKILRGHWGMIGHGIVLMPLEDTGGLSSGKVYFKIDKKDNRKLKDFYDDVVDIEYEWLKLEATSSTKTPEKRKDFKVTDSETWSGLEDYLTERFWSHKSKKENIWLRDLFNDPKGVFDEEGERLWKTNKSIKGKFLSIEFALKERIRMFVYRNYKGLEDYQIAKKCNIIRKENGINRTIDFRTLENYRSRSFFSKVPLASNALGVWLEGFVVLKMKYIVSELLKDYNHTTVQLKEQEKELLERTLILGGGGSGSRADFSFGDRFFLNVKNQLVRRGNFHPTPEARLAQENKGSFGVLNIKSLRPGIAQLYLYTESRVDRGRGSVPSKIPFSKFKSISGWLDLLLEILQVIDG